MASKPLIQHFVDDVNGVIDKYRDQGLTIGEVVGVFQLAILDIWAEWSLKIKDGGDFPPEEDL